MTQAAGRSSAARAGAERRRGRSWRASCCRAAPRRGLRGLGEVNVGADRAQFLDDEAPTGRSLERHLKLLTDEALEKPAHVAAQRRRDPGAADLAPVSVSSHSAVI